MNDTSHNAPNDIPPPSSADDNRLTADEYDAFLDALDLLYLRGNLSARLKFFENWPIAAQYIFDDELMAFDREGTTDVERRMALEEAAEEKRLELLDIVATLEEKSVEKNVLQTDYVENTIKALGRDLALLMYAPKFVDRYCPDTTPVAPPTDDVVVEEPVDEKPVKVSADPGDIPDTFDVAEVKKAAGQPTIEPLADDALDGIEPISTGSQADQTVPMKPSEPDAAALGVQDGVPAPAQPSEAGPSAEAASPVSEVAPVVNPVSPVAQDSGPPVAPPSASPAAPVEAPAQPVVSSQPPPSDPTVQDATQQAKHKALDDVEPIASQKMTFVPSQPQSESSVEAVASVENRPQPGALSDPLETKSDDGKGEPPASA